jgi:hypothetical protein
MITDNEKYAWLGTMRKKLENQKLLIMQSFPEYSSALPGLDRALDIVLELEAEYKPKQRVEFRKCSGCEQEILPLAWQGSNRCPLCGILNDDVQGAIS